MLQCREAGKTGNIILSDFFSSVQFLCCSWESQSSQAHGFEMSSDFLAMIAISFIKSKLTSHYMYWDSIQCTDIKNSYIYIHIYINIPRFVIIQWNQGTRVHYGARLKRIGPNPLIIRSYVCGSMQEILASVFCSTHWIKPIPTISVSMLALNISN